MRTISNAAFERRGARGCSNSEYIFCQTTCCDRWCVHDTELDDLYVDGTELGRVISLLRSRGEPDVPCPLCGAGDWDSQPISDLEGVPEPWAWAVRR